MGYYKDTGSLQSMASAEAILKKRMPEKVGILPVAELLFVAESMWVGEHDMKGHFHPSFRFVKAKRYNAKPHVLIELDGETLADINGRSKYYEGFSRCVDRKPEEGAWIEPTEFGMEQRKMSEEKKAKNEWVHFRELRARCPVCKKVAHVACKNGTYFFVHDAYDPFARHNAVETTEPVFKILFDGFVSVNGREPVKSGNRTLTNEAMMQDMFPRKGK